MKSDQEKWDAWYRGKRNDPREADEFLVAHEDLLTRGRALDLACGLGGNALFLAERGYCVHALDISFVALSRLRAEAKRRSLSVHSVVADLDYHPLPRATYDLVSVFHFFSVSLVASIKACLKKGGLLFYSSYNYRHKSLKPEFNPAYLVPAGGLMPSFVDFEIIVDEAEAGAAGNVSRLIARKRAQ